MPRRYQLGEASPKAAVTVGNTSTLLLAANSLRTHAILQNVSDEDMYLGFPTVTQDLGNALVPNGLFVIDEKWHYVGAVYGICTSGGKVLKVTEF